MVDKLGLVILFLIVLFVGTSIVMVTGTVPEIFRQGEQINQTNILLQQRIALTEQQKHDDEVAINQTIHEDLARDKQVITITAHIDKTLDRIQFNILKLIKESENRSKISADERSEIMDTINNNTLEILRKLNNTGIS